MQDCRTWAFLGTRACNCRQQSHAYRTSFHPSPSRFQAKAARAAVKERRTNPKAEGAATMHPLPCVRAVPTQAPRQELTPHTSRLVVPSTQLNFHRWEPKHPILAMSKGSIQPNPVLGVIWCRLKMMVICIWGAWKHLLSQHHFTVEGPLHGEKLGF